MDWGGIELVVFDVDGTLYNQRALRSRMALALFKHVLAKRDLSDVRILRTYRHGRELMGDTEKDNFERHLIDFTAASTGFSAMHVEAVIAEWIDQRPLPYLRTLRYPKLVELFSALKRRRKTVGVYSDYPASAKLTALGLEADFIVCAPDQDVRVLKPNPRGLEILMNMAGSNPFSTILIGDRIDRDGLAARRANVRCLIRSPKRLTGWRTFRRYDDVIFSSLLAD